MTTDSGQAPAAGPIAVSDSNQPLRLVGWLCAWMLFALTLVSGVDVIGRYVFNSPLPNANDLVRALMGIVIFAGLPLVSADNAHLRAGFFDHLVSGSLLRVREVVVTLLSALACAVWTWQLGRQAIDMRSTGEVLGTVPMPVWYLVALMTLASGASTVLLLLHVRAAWSMRVTGSAGGASHGIVRHERAD